MLFAPLFAALVAAEVPALGAWSANGALLDLKDESGKVVGRLAAAGGPCALPPGTELLRGTLLDDSLSAQVRLCLVSEKCGSAEESALAVLLVTRTLTGGVHTKAACAQEVHSLVLRRPGGAQAMTPPPPRQRLSNTPAPRAPVVQETPAAAPGGPETRVANAAVGEIPGHPVGDARHPAGYDPRDARRAGTPQGQADKLLSQGAALLGEGRFERARKLFQDALEKDPQRAEAYNGVGVTFYARGDLDEALAWYKRSLEADPRFGDAFYNMACIYALQSHKELAFRYLRLAGLNHYQEREALEKDADLAALHGEPQWQEILDQMSAEAKPHP